MVVLLDTSVLIDTLRSRNGRKELLARLLDEGHRLTTTVLNLAEVYAGIRPGEEAHTSAFLDSLECFDFRCETGKQAGLLKSFWASKGRTLSLSDVIIAAIALEHGCTLFTDNQKDFPMPELELFPSGK